MTKYTNVFETLELSDKYNKNGRLIPNLIIKVYGDVNVSYEVLPKLIAKFNVEDNSKPTYIMSRYGDAINGNYYTEIEIDGVVQPSVVNSYTFDTTGKHIVKYTLSDPTTIGDAAFQHCTDLTSITIPNGVTTIGQDAFNGCTDLTNITIPDSVTTIGEYAFYGCIGFTSITIPNSVTIIDERAFQGCTGLTNITIGNNVTSINDGAFNGCTSLTSITIPDGVTYIGEGAFYHCSGLTSVIIPNTVTTIGLSVFNGCTSLTNITIPDSVTTINDYVFYNCSSLTSITIQATIPPALSDDIDNTFTNTNNCLIYVPSTSVEVYKASRGWRNLASRIQAIPQE